MGKGGTRFVGEAIAHRSGKSSSFPTGKERKKNLEKFLETGVHPEVERARQEAAKALPPLPLTDISRSFVFMDFKIGSQAAGRLVIELFDDLIPGGAHHLRNRCLPGSAAGLAGAHVHKIVPHFAMFFGKSPAASEGMRLQPYKRLQSIDAGTVSISLNGDEVAIALAQALKLDETHQVVGRIHLGKDLIDTFNNIKPRPDDSPPKPITIERCGATNHKGTHEDLEGSSAGPPKSAAEKLAEQSEEARNTVLEALEVGLGQKRRAEDPAGPSKPAVKARLLDTMLRDLSGSSSASSEED